MYISLCYLQTYIKHNHMYVYSNLYSEIEYILSIYVRNERAWIYRHKISFLYNFYTSMYIYVGVKQLYNK